MADPVFDMLFPVGQTGSPALSASGGNDGGVSVVSVDGKDLTPPPVTGDPVFSMLHPEGVQNIAATPQVAPTQPPLEHPGIAGEVARQVGLASRYGLEGVGSIPQILGGPMEAMGMKGAGGNAGTYIADQLGLPTPQGSTERVIGDVSRMVAAGAVPLGLAGKVSPITNLGKTMTTSLLENPAHQLVSAASAGAAGGVTREAGGDPVLQFGASLLGGMAAPATMNIAQKVGNLAQRVVFPAANMEQVDQAVNSAIQGNGFTLADLPANIQSSIRADVQKSMQTGGDLSPDAIRRLADYRLTQTTPTAATLTLDPAMVSQQKNLAKLGINSKDQAAQQLGRVENANNRQLITGLNDLGAAGAPDQFGVGKTMLDSLNNHITDTKNKIGLLYDSAKNSTGRDALLDHYDFTQNANTQLDQNLKGIFVPSKIRGMLNDFADGKIPLNIHTSEQFKTILATAQRDSGDGNVRAAIGHIRDALDNTPLLNAPNPGLIGPSGYGQATIDSFNAARSAHRDFRTQVENIPALKSAESGAQPDTFFTKQILNSNVNNMKATLALLPENVLGKVKSGVVDFLKNKALNGAPDETGNFSQSSYNKALKALGDAKLSAIFDPEEIAQLKAIGRVSSYEQFQPKGSAVNNSNTAGASLSALLDRIGNSSMLSKIPFGKDLAQPAQNIVTGMKAKAALDIQKGLLAPPATLPGQPTGLLLSPAAFIPQEDNRKKGLFSP